MASVTLEDVTIDFPIYGAQKSFRQELVQRTGGFISRDAQKGRVTVRALENVSMTIGDGDRVGLLGHNGAGKSTLLRVIAGVYEPTAGRVSVEGKLSSLLNTCPGMDPEDTGYENIVTCGIFLGMTRSEVARKLPEIAETCELGDYLTLPIRTYSAGMVARLAFAIATSIDPGILVIDEGLGGGDERFAERAIKRVDALVGRSHILVLASHSYELVRSLCNKAVLLQTGRLAGAGSVEDVIELYRTMSGTIAQG